MLINKQKEANNMNKKEVEELLTKYHQEHILKIMEHLEEEKQQEIIKQIEAIDLKQLEDLYQDTKKAKQVEVNKLEPIKSVNPDKLTKEEKSKYEAKGIEVVKNNEFAVVTMSGGQGTRLGFSGPKGTFKINVEPEPKYLFEIIVDTLKRANKEYEVTIPWYIMTSKENNDDIIKFMEEKNYFGYPKEYVSFFTQGELPLINTEGKLMVGEDGRIKEASNGNGSIFESMDQKGVLQDMKNRGIKWVYIGSIDNVLLKMVDILLMGIAIDQGSLIATRSLFKNNPKEKVGSLCSQNGKIKVIEYSELPEEMTEAVDENGELLYGESHIMCNLFSLEALEKVGKVRLPYHRAFKKYAYIDENGNLVKPEKENAYKFEYFIFDSFEYFDQISILRGKREEDFAPVKNAQGVDSPETAAKLYNQYWFERK